MCLRYFWLIIILVSCTNCMAGNIVISGKVPSHAGKVVSVNEYLDFISTSRKVVMQYRVDSTGFFLINLRGIKGPMINLEIENLSLDIYVNDGNSYIIGEADYKLILKQEKGIPTNEIITRLNKELLDNWVPLFIDTKTKIYKKDGSPDSILSEWRKIGRQYLEKPDSLLRSLVYYKLAYYKLLYFDMADAALNKELNRFEDEYFNQKAIQPSNPFYIKLLEYYLTVRMNTIHFSRSDKKNDRVAALIAEAGFFKNEMLRQLATVAGVKMVFRFPLNTMEKKKVLDDLRCNVSNYDLEPGMKEILGRVILMNERLKIGDVFPIIPLKNINGLSDSITNAKSELILVDFWATWCLACVEGMNKFKQWINQSNGKLTIVCISVDRDFNKMKDFMLKKQWPSSVLKLYNGEQGNYFNKVPIQQFPTYYLLNSRGEILAIPSIADSISNSLKKFM